MTPHSLDSSAYQAELETQNQALRYAQLAAEGASERFSALFSSVPLALMVVDENGMVLQSNARALGCFRPLESDPPINFLRPLVAPGFADRVDRAFSDARSLGRGAALEVIFHSGSLATLTGDLHIARIDHPRGDPAEFVCAVVDQGPLLAQRAALRQTAEELQRRTDEIERMQAQLRESEKMQAIGTMAGGIAHDFNNILSAILGNVELARQDADIDSPAQVSLMEIEKAGRRARDLVRQILMFSRKEPPRRATVDVAEVVNEVVRVIRKNLPRHITLQVQQQADTPRVLADTAQIEQALTNLCMNAWQAIGEKAGTIKVDLFAEPDATGRSRACVAVHDDGAGIHADHLDRVFEPFFTTKPTGQGTGLGLAVVHGVMRSHDGDVQVQSTPGLGSVFYLRFPAHTASVTQMNPVATTPAGPTAADHQPGQGQHVMYVDDDRALVFLVERALRREGFRVSSFTNPQMALDALRHKPYDFDLIVTDYNMPAVSGIDLLRQARTIRADLPVALASGYVTTEIEQSAFAEGAKALIHKPNDVAELVATVQRLIRDNTSP